MSGACDASLTGYGQGKAFSMSGPGPVEEKEVTVSTNPIYDYKVGEEVLVEGIAFDLNQTRAWSTAKILKLIPSVAGCYEIEFLSTGKRSIVHEYRLRRQA